MPYAPGDRVRFTSQDQNREEWGTVVETLPEIAAVRIRLDDGALATAPARALATAASLVADAIVADAIAAEVYAQLDELSDDTVGLIGGLTDGDEEGFNRLLALAEDLRETLRSTLDVRLSDWTADHLDAR